MTTRTEPKHAVVDLFCGAGGFTRGLADAGIDVTIGVDAWHRAIESYSANFEHDAVCVDVRKLSGRQLLDMVGPVWLVVGGPPCQGFSAQRIGPDQDERNDLLLEFIRLVAEVQPVAFAMENVMGLLGRRGRDVFACFNSMATNAGYVTYAYKIDAADYGVAQHRRRVVVFGNRPGNDPPVLLRAAEQRRTVRSAIGDLPEPPIDPEQFDRDPLHRRSRLSELNRRRLEHIPPGGGFEDLPEGLRAPCHRQGAHKIGHRQVYGRLDPDRPAVTITARFDSFTRGRFAHPWQHRNLTLREGARLQGFPDEHQFFGTREEIAALIGNAIPPPVAAAIGKALTAEEGTATQGSLPLAW